MRKAIKHGKHTAFSLFIFTLIVLVCGVGAFFARPKKPAILAYVNGEPIYVEEFQLFMTRNRGKAAAYFYENYGAADGPGFWDSLHGEFTPLEYLKKLSLKEAVETKVLQSWAKQKGLIDNIDYISIKELWERENEQRAGRGKLGAL